MRWDRFISFVNVSTWYVKFICLDDCFCDEFSFLVDIVGGNVVAECVVNLACPLRFIEIDEGFSLVCFDVFLGDEVGCEYRKMVRGELF